MFFSGNLQSKIVFVEFNAGPGNLLEVKRLYRNLILPNFRKGEIIVNSVEDYRAFFTEFARMKMKENNKLTTYDRKQLAFAEVFWDKSYEKGTELNTAIELREQNLQVELVPYASDRFSFSNFSNEYIEDCFNSVKNMIDAYPRELILITGKLESIERYLESNGFSVNDRHQCKPKDSTSKPSYTLKASKGFYNIIPVLYLESYKSQSLLGQPMKKYAAFCRQILSK